MTAVPNPHNHPQRPRPDSARFSLQLIAQIMVSAATIAIIVLAPPARGPMMAVPLHGSGAHVVLRHGDVQLLGQGVLPGSLVINSQGDHPFWFALTYGVLVLNGRSTACGFAPTRKRVV